MSVSEGKGGKKGVGGEKPLEVRGSSAVGIVGAHTNELYHTHTHTHTHTHLQLDPPPAYLQSRIEMFDKLKTEYDAMIAGLAAN